MLAQARHTVCAVQYVQCRLKLEAFVHDRSSRFEVMAIFPETEGGFGKTTAAWTFHLEPFSFLFPLRGPHSEVSYF